MQTSEKSMKPGEIVASDQIEGTTAEQGAKIIRRKSQIRNSLKFSRRSSLRKDYTINYKKKYRKWEGQEIHYIPGQSNCMQLSQCPTAEFIHPVFYAPKLQAPSTKLSFDQGGRMDTLQPKCEQQNVNVGEDDSSQLYRCSFDQLLSYKMKISSLQQALQKLRRQNEQLNVQLQFFDQVGEFIMEREAYITRIISELQGRNHQIERLLQEAKYMKKELKELTRELNQEEYFLQQSVAHISNQKNQFQTVVKSELQLSKQLREAEQQKFIRENHALNDNLGITTKPKCPTTKMSFESIPNEGTAVKSSDLLRNPSTDVNNCQQCTQTETDLAKKQSQLTDKSEQHRNASFNNQQIGILRRKLNSDKLVHQNRQLRKQNLKLMRKINSISQNENGSEIRSDSELDLSFSPKRDEME